MACGGTGGCFRPGNGKMGLTRKKDLACLCEKKVHARVRDETVREGCGLRRDERLLRLWLEMRKCHCNQGADCVELQYVEIAHNQRKHAQGGRCRRHGIQILMEGLC